MLAEVEIYEAYIKGKLDKEDIKNQSSKNVPLLMEELKMKFKGVTIHKNLKCNTWYTRYRLNGKQFYISAKSQKECYDKLKQALKQQNKTTEKTKLLTFIEWYNKWFALFKEDGIKDETLREYNIQLKKIPDIIKNKPIKSINQLEIEELIKTIKKGRAKQKFYEFLKPIFKKAKDYNIINDNIFDIIEKPRHKREDGIALTITQQQIFTELCKNHMYGKLYLFMMWQGLRIGETLALTINDIKDNKVYITKQLTKKGIVNYTKNTQSTRIIPLFNKTKQIIDFTQKGRLFNITESTANKNLKKLVENTDLPQNLTTHDLRHTFITNCQNMNIPEYVIQAIVGHEIGSKVTKQIYTHFNLEDNLSYLNKLND